MDKNLVLAKIKDVLSKNSYVLSARVYGSWLHKEKAVDVDIAIIIPSQLGVVESIVYESLKELRLNLVEEINCDIDLIPHTIDEIEDLRSPLWYPRYNPSLCYGETIKGKFLMNSISTREKKFEFSDLTAYVLLDNRTICRRQLLRSLKDMSGRIYVSKLLHGHGNALTFYSCKNRIKYLASPSDLEFCFRLFDEIYGVDSIPVLKFLRSCNEELDFQKALKLMFWYENLVSLTILYKYPTSLYNSACLKNFV